MAESRTSGETAIGALYHGDDGNVAAFQNTPAAFHGRLELSAELTEELRQVSGP